MSDLVFFEKLGFNQAYKTLSADKSRDIGAAGLEALPTILATLVRVTHPCDVKKVLEKPLELLVIFELYFEVPGFAKKFFDKTINSLEGTIPADVEVMTGGVNDQLVPNANNQLALPNANNQLALNANNQIVLDGQNPPVDPEEAELMRQERLATRRANLARAMANETNANAELVRAQGNVEVAHLQVKHVKEVIREIDQKKSYLSKKAKDELKAIAFSLITSACACGLIYSGSDLFLTIGTGLTASAAMLPVVGAGFAGTVVGDTGTVIVKNLVNSGGIALKTVSNTAKSYWNSLLTTVGVDPIKINDEPPASQSSNTESITPTFGERVTEGYEIFNEQTTNLAAGFKGTAVNILNKGINQNAFIVGCVSVYVLFFMMFYLIFISYLNKIIDAPLPQVQNLINDVFKRPNMDPIIQNNQGQPAIQNGNPRQLLRNAGVENQDFQPQQPQQNQYLQLGNQPQALPGASRNQPANRIGINADPEAFEYKIDGGFTRVRRLPSLPTLRAPRFSSSKKKRYTHRRRALRTGKGDYRPTKTGRKV